MVFSREAAGQGQLPRAGMATGAPGAALMRSSLKEVVSQQSHNCNGCFWSQPHQVPVNCVLGVGCAHLAQTPSSGAVSEPAEILFFFCQLFLPI